MEFVLPPLQALAYVAWGVIVLGVLLLGGIIRGRQGPLTYLLSSVICIALGIFLLNIRNTGSFSIESHRVVLKSPLLKTRIVEEGTVARAWIQDLGDGEWSPARKLSGSAAGLIRSGSFRLRNGRKAFLVLEGNRAVCVETDKGELYLFGTTDFQTFLDELKRRLPRLAEKLETPNSGV